MCASLSFLHMHELASLSKRGCQSGDMADSSKRKRRLEPKNLQFWFYQTKGDREKGQNRTDLGSLVSFMSHFNDVCVKMS